MAITAETIDRLKAQLLTSGLSQKDQPLFQVINQLIDAVRQSLAGVQLLTGGGGGGGGGGGLANASYLTQNPEPGLPLSRQVIAGQGINIQHTPNGRTVIHATIPFNMDGGEGGEEGPPGPPGLIGPQGPIGPAGSNAVSFMYAFDAEDGEDGLPGIPGPQGFPGSQGPQGQPGMFGIDGLDGEEGSEILVIMFGPDNWFIAGAGTTYAWTPRRKDEQDIGEPNIGGLHPRFGWFDSGIILQDSLSHAITGYGTIQGLANATADGVATTTSRSDHTHKRDVRVAKAGADIGTRNRLNFIEGTNVTIGVVDDPGNDEVDITINSSGSGGSGPPVLVAPLVSDFDEDILEIGPQMSKEFTPNDLAISLMTTNGYESVPADGGVVIPRQYTILSGHALILGDGARFRIL